MRPTRHQLKLEPDESAMERKGLSRRTVYTTTKRDGFTSPCLLGFYIWKGTESVSVWVWQSHCFSRCTFVRVHTACLRVSARITCTNGPIQPLIFCKKNKKTKETHRRSESPERPWDIWGTHLHYLIFSQEMAQYFSTVVCRDRSLRLGLRWKTEVRQQVTVCF